MRYTFINAVVCTMSFEDKTVTPMIGYILKDNETNTFMSYSRKEAYYLINKYGATNVEPKSRVDEGGVTRYYLKLKDNKFKVNEFLVDYTDNAHSRTEEYLEAINDAMNTYGYKI